MNWNISKIENLEGKTILITGANSGLGYESTKVFAANGANVILSCRNIQKGQLAKDEILKSHPKANLTVEELDLMSFKSIAKFAKKINSSVEKVDVLLNNAGIMTTPYFLTEDGYEAQFGTNHLGHFLLTSLLFEKIKSTPNARIVNVSSLAHRGGEMNFGDVNYSDGSNYATMTAYRRSKMANLYFSYELKRKIDLAGLDIKVLSAHPGASETNLSQYIDGKWWFKLAMPLFKVLGQSAADGALPQIRACVDENAKSGEYYGPDGFGEMKGKPVLVKSTKESHNPKIAKQLWSWSEELCNCKFEIN